MGNYAASVTNAFGSTNSADALLAISGPPTIITQPTNQYVPLGGMATLSVVAVGTPPLSYQWKLVGGPNLPYATNSVLIVTNVQNGDKYNVQVSNSLGSVKSANATLHLGVPPSIVTQPTNESVAVGATATFSVIANGSAPLAYQWLFNGRNLLSATNGTLVIPNAQISDGGRYSVRISNTYGSVRSGNVTLSVGEPPVIVVAPTNQTVRLGDTAAFKIVATGTAPLSYQWSFGGTNLAGATTNALVITNAQVGDTGSYAVVISNPFGSTNSPDALLTVGVPPTIVLQPTNQTASVGEGVTFATLADGTPPLHCQWTFNGTSLAGATDTVLVITNAQLSDAGTYAAQMSNAFGSETSSNTVLSVGLPPVIVAQPMDQAVVLGGAAAFEVTAAGTPPLQYQWSFEGTNLVAATNTLLAITNAQLSDGGQYAVRISNAFGVVNSSNALLSVGIAPAIVVQPTNLAVAVGGLASFSVEVTGTPPLSYQWSFNGTNVVDATNSVLLITNVQSGDGGSYAVEVSNAFGTETSSNAVLSVGLPPVIVLQPVDQAVILGGAAAFEVTVEGTPPLQYQWSFEGMGLLAATNSLLAITNVQLSDRGHYAVRVANAFGVTNSSNALLSVGIAPAIVMQPTNLAVAVGGLASFSVEVTGTPPLSYQWSFNGTNLVDATNSVLLITNVQSGDGGSYAVEVSNAFGSDQSSNAVLSVGLPPVVVMQPVDQAVILGGAAVFEVTADGTPPLQYQWSFEGMDLVEATNSLLAITNVQLSDGGQYAVRISNAFGVTNSSNALLSVGIAPAIVTQPTNLAVVVGGEALLSVVANGTLPLSYQWSFNGTNVADATNSVLLITNVQSGDGGSYAVEVSNAFGSDQSSNAVLSVGLPPAIVMQPVDQAVILGGAAVFEVTADGTPPLQYQWSFEGMDLVAATNTLLAITNVQLSDGGHYAVKVSNAFGVVNSSNALLTIGIVPAVVTQPTNLAVTVGEVAAFSVETTGTPPLSHQWSFNGTNLVDATNSVLLITNVQSGDGGSYAVEVSNAFGSDQSSNAVLSVGLPPVVVMQPVDQAVILGGAAVFEVTADGTPPLQYQWSFEGMDLVEATNSLLAITNVQLSDGGHYAVRVSNAFGVVNSSNALLSVGIAPAIVMQPTNLAVAVGGLASFSVEVTGTPPLSYQWTFNGTNLLDATNSALLITNVQSGDGGSYAVEASNAFGSDQTSNAVLSVGLPPVVVMQPVDQAVILGGAAAFEVTAAGTPPLQYQWSFEGMDLVAATNTLLAITNVQLSDGGHYAVKVSNAFGVVNSSNALLTIGIAPAIVMQPTNLAVAVGEVASFSVEVTGTPPLSYQWTFNGTNVVDATNSVLLITNVQSGDGGSYALEVSNAFGSDQSSNAVLSVGLPPVIVMQPMDQAVILGGAAAFEVTAAGTPPLQYQWSFESTDLVAATNTLLAITNAQLSDDGHYAVRVANAFGVTNSSNALLRIGIVPAVVTQPTNLAVTVGEVAAFSVEATGTPPLSYQWIFNGTNVVDATNSVLLITNVQSGDGGSYAVEVSNAFGSETSSNAVLSLGEPPSILVEPANQILVAGAVARFGITAAGTLPLEYQWRRHGIDLTDGARITGANSSDLSISNVTQGDSGLYSITVSNSWGYALSSNGTLFVYVIDHFAWDPIPSPRFIGVPFPARIQAVDATNGLVNAFAGSVSLGVSTGSPSAGSTAGVSVNPSVSGAFVLGTWTGSLTISQAVGGAVLVADDGSGHFGYANPINVVGLPSLSVALSGASLLISWPAEASAFAPEKSADMFSWSPLTSTIDLAGDIYQTRVPITATGSFFRLRFIGP